MRYFCFLVGQHWKNSSKLQKALRIFLWIKPLYIEKCKAARRAISFPILQTSASAAETEAVTTFPVKFISSNKGILFEQIMDLDFSHFYLHCHPVASANWEKAFKLPRWVLLSPSSLTPKSLFPLPLRDNFSGEMWRNWKLLPGSASDLIELRSPFRKSERTSAHLFNWREFVNLYLLLKRPSWCVMM
jgi:hypothetical protein